jgi:hypothetical protein
MSGQGDLQPSPDLPDAEQQRLTIGPQLSLDGEQLGSGSRAPSGLQGPLSHVDSAVAHRPDLPSNKVCDESFDDAYVAFILHCNPAVPPDTNTTELRKAFRSPPKSDGKSFSTFTLFELIRKLESKEIKTWGDLAMRLGVEPPAMDKGQSAQKVQQYAVRLKVSYSRFQRLPMLISCSDGCMRCMLMPFSSIFLEIVTYIGLRFHLRGRQSWVDTTYLQKKILHCVRFFPKLGQNVEEKGQKTRTTMSNLLRKSRERTLQCWPKTFIQLSQPHLKLITRQHHDWHGQHLTLRWSLHFQKRLWRCTINGMAWT